MIIPAGHRVMVKPVELAEYDDRYKSAKAIGIEVIDFTLDKERTAIDQGTVLSMGKTAFLDFGGDAWCKVGDLVAYARHGGKWVTDPFTKEKFLILNDEDVVAVIKE